MNQVDKNIKVQIIEDIEKHYKNVSVIVASLSGDFLTLAVQGLYSHKVPWAAKRILKKYKDIRVIRFTGGWLEGVYTRETLKRAGYKF